METDVRSVREPGVLVVIPARGGSKGIPRKNLRTLVGKPLIQYSIETALASSYAPVVVVSTDDDEIEVVARRSGALVHRRSEALGGDAVTLDPVIHDALLAQEAAGAGFDVVVTVQPTSPLLRTESLDEAVRTLLNDPGLDTIISAKDATHLTWRRDGERFVPNYEKRLNRQYLPKTYSETGGFVVTRRAFVTESGRFGPSVGLHLLDAPESIDIDGHEDWGLCAHFLRRRTLLFVVVGNRTLGLGHVYNSLVLANDLAEHEVSFLVDRDSRLGADVIAAHNYPVTVQGEATLADEVLALGPDIVINDRLDTELDYMLALTDGGITTVNIEDLGPGAAHAHSVINALYPNAATTAGEHVHQGARYASLRDEFMLAEPGPARDRVGRVLVMFGGTDPSRLTRKVVAAIEAWCARSGIAIDVVVGPGYHDPADLEEFEHATVRHNVKNLSEYMQAADVAFTSAGRTLFELAAMATPAIVLAQNERELTHTFASEENGFLNLGLGSAVTSERILAALERLVTDAPARRAARERLLASDVRGGRRRVIDVIERVTREV